MTSQGHSQVGTNNFALSQEKHGTFRTVCQRFVFRVKIPGYDSRKTFFSRPRNLLLEEYDPSTRIDSTMLTAGITDIHLERRAGVV